jgi:hypothetical protein
LVLVGDGTERTALCEVARAAGRGRRPGPREWTAASVVEELSRRLLRRRRPARAGGTKEHP